MRLIGLAVVLALSLILVASADAQQQGRVWRIGILSMAPTTETPVFEAFRKALQELGYVDGKNIVLDFRLSAGRVDRLNPLASELVRSGVDVIVTDGGSATRAARSATKEIAIVIGTGASDPVATGLAKSLAPSRRQHHRSHDDRHRNSRQAGRAVERGTAELVPLGRAP